MSLRLRLTLVAASVVAIVVAAASMTTYFVMRHELYSQVDSTISDHAGRIQQDPGFALRGFGPFNGDATTIVNTTGQAAGHYERYFQRANHPTQPQAFWVRYTIFSPARRPHDAIGELWAVVFNGSTGRHRQTPAPSSLG